MDFCEGGGWQRCPEAFILPPLSFPTVCAVFYNLNKYDFSSPGLCSFLFRVFNNVSGCFYISLRPHLGTHCQVS